MFSTVAKDGMSTQVSPPSVDITVPANTVGNVWSDTIMGAPAGATATLLARKVMASA